MAAKTGGGGCVGGKENAGQTTTDDMFVDAGPGTDGGSSAVMRRSATDATVRTHVSGARANGQHEQVAAAEGVGSERASWRRR